MRSTLAGRSRSGRRPVHRPPPVEITQPVPGVTTIRTCASPFELKLAFALIHDFRARAAVGLDSGVATKQRHSSPPECRSRAGPGVCRTGIGRCHSDCQQVCASPRTTGHPRRRCMRRRRAVARPQAETPPATPLMTRSASNRSPTTTLPTSNPAAHTAVAAAGRQHHAHRPCHSPPPTPSPVSHLGLPSHHLMAGQRAEVGWPHDQWASRTESAPKPPPVRGAPNCRDALLDRPAGTHRSSATVPAFTGQSQIG